MTEAEQLLSSTEVAALFRVSSRTVTAWANAGRLPSVRTPGGHHRFPASAVYAALNGEGSGDGSPAPEGQSHIDLTDGGARARQASEQDRQQAFHGR